MVFKQLSLHEDLFSSIPAEEYIQSKKDFATSQILQDHTNQRNNAIHPSSVSAAQKSENDHWKVSVSN
jgi:hypothetical protein